MSEAKEQRKRVGLVIPVLNNFEGCVDLLQSVRTKHIVSIYIMPQYRHQVALAAAWNQGIQRAFSDGCDYVLVCNDDIIFAPETLDNFVTEFDRVQPDVVLLSGSNILLQLPSKWAIMDYHTTEEPTTAEHPDFSCFMVGPNFFEIMGTFDENFYPAWREDQDMHQRIMLAGKHAYVSTACPIAHVGSVSTANLPDVNSSRSDDHFFRKWGSHNISPPQAFATPYNDPSKTYRDW